MQNFTDSRTAETQDEIWLVQHPPVFTQGQAGKPEHLLQRSEIPVVQSDRGGQITYHAPGQQVMYVLIDIKRHENLNVRQLVTALEQTVVKTLAEYGIESYPKLMHQACMWMEKDLFSWTAYSSWVLFSRASIEYQYGSESISLY